MVYIRHHAIIVTSHDLPAIEHVRKLALEVWSAQSTLGTELSQMVSPLIPSVANGYHTLFIAPDGSKEGWGESNDCNKRRAEFIAKLQELPDQWLLDWYVVCYGGDDRKTFRVDTSGAYGYVGWEGE